MYPIDEQYLEIPVEQGGYVLWHRLERATKAQQIQRDTKIKTEEIAHEDKFETKVETDLANIYIWNECARAIRGYSLGNGHTPDEWIEITEEIRNVMPSEHKAKAATFMFDFDCRIEKANENGGGFPLLGATEIRVKLDLPNDTPGYTHVLRRPNDSEWLGYKNKFNSVYQVRGSKVPHYFSNANLTAAITLYDALLIRLEGATLAGEEFNSDRREEFLKALDPAHKREVIRVFADYWSVGRANLGTRS